MIDTWDLRTMREAKTYRDAHPDPASADTDALLDAMLATAEKEAASGRVPTATPRIDDEIRQRPAVSGALSRHSGGQPATDAQLGYLASLAAKLGHELQTPRDKSHASLLIDAAKRELAKRGPVASPARPERMATPGQQAYLDGLLTERVHDYADDTDPATITFAQATTMIDRLRLMPRRPRGVMADHGIAPGHYAWDDAEDVTRFYRVTDDGYIRVIAGPEEHPYTGKLNEALLAIRDDQPGAAALYGRKIGRCGRCHRRLSDKTSRERGLGPYCAEKAW